MTKHIWQNLLVAFLALITLGLFVLLVLEILPESPELLETKQVIEVSSSPINKGEASYLNEVRGILYNGGEEAVTVDWVRVHVQDAQGNRRDVTIAGKTLPPRTEWDILHTELSSWGYQRVIRVEAMVDGEPVKLSNETEKGLLTAPVVILAVLFASLVYGTVTAAKKRYYMYLEDKEDEEKS